MDRYKNATLKSIVTDDFRAAAVFEKFSLDFCCGGGVTIEQACSKKGLDPALVYAGLQELDQKTGDQAPTFSAWPSDELINYIVRVHHEYVREAIPVLLTHTQKVAAVHGERHPEVVEVARHFNAVAKDMAAHMMKEEHVLFPYILELVKAKRNGTPLEESPFGGVQNPIRMMEMEHKAAGDEMEAIRSLTANYTPPDDACTTYRISFRELQLFEEDLHRHVHLENNILFPKAMALEQELTAPRS
ncbi:MAG: iron-sulfur cluster repair di-iron protein [Bacteroidia bacterium]|nr:MAG: iron-sulfur cluster repair di-iron protein [Bacteroidia bacterium]